MKTSSDSRHIAITGVSRGLGRALVEQFYKRGHRVTGCARDAEAIAELNERWGERGNFTVIDVAGEDEVLAWAGQTVERYGCPDLLINNAGMMHDPGKLWEIPAREVERLFEVNVLGLLHVLRAFVPAFLEKGSGLLINMSSGAGRMGLPQIGAYCGTKWAVEGLSKSLATELPEGIGCVALSPGMVDTDMLRACYGEAAASHHNAEAWAETAADYILSLRAEQSGESLRTPGGDGD